MKNSVLSLFLASAAFSLTGAYAQTQSAPLSPVAVPEFVNPYAQTQPAPFPPVVAPALIDPESSKRGQPIKVRNISASMMAWRLDPEHHDMPIEIQMSEMNAADFLPDNAQEAYGAKVSLEGIDRIVAIDPQNALLVFGTPEATARIEKVMEVLDKPLRQVEVEVRYLRLNKGDLKKFAIELMPQTSGNGPFIQGKAPKNIEARVLELIQKDRTRIITAPRVVAINHLTAALYSWESAPATLATNLNGKIQEIPGPPFEMLDKNLLVSTSIGFTVRPTINDDDTISMLLAPGRVLKLSESPSGKPLWQKNLGGIQTLSNVNDGETVALLGADTRLFYGLRPQIKKPSDVLILVTPRILRRVGDDVPTQ